MLNRSSCSVCSQVQQLVVPVPVTYCYRCGNHIVWCYQLSYLNSTYIICCLLLHTARIARDQQTNQRRKRLRVRRAKTGQDQGLETSQCGWEKLGLSDCNLGLDEFHHVSPASALPSSSPLPISSSPSPSTSTSLSSIMGFLIWFHMTCDMSQLWPTKVNSTLHLEVHGARPI